MASCRIYLLSDIHVGNDEVYKPKKKLLEKLKKITTVTDVVIMAGDLTDSGEGKSKVWCCSCYNNTNQVDQIAQFRDEVYYDIKSVTPNVLMCHGNHDDMQSKLTNQVMVLPMIQFIQEQIRGVNNDGHYMYIINGICFVALGKYPDETAIQYMDQIRMVTKDEYPYIIIFHYQLFNDPNYDFWTQQEKNRFVDYIMNVPGVLSICHGHVHTTTSYVVGGVVVNCGSALDSFLELQVEGGKLIKTKIITLD